MGVDDLSEGAKHLGDAASVLVTLATLAKVLPSIAAGLTVLWLLIRIWESDTIRQLTRRPLTGKRPDE